MPKTNQYDSHCYSVLLYSIPFYSRSPDLTEIKKFLYCSVQLLDDLKQKLLFLLKEKRNNNKIKTLKHGCKNYEIVKFFLIRVANYLEFKFNTSKTLPRPYASPLNKSDGKGKLFIMLIDSEDILQILCPTYSLE